MAFYETSGGIQERMFVDIGEEGQVVGVDIVLSGKRGSYPSEFPISIDHPLNSFHSLISYR